MIVLTTWIAHKEERWKGAVGILRDETALTNTFREKKKEKSEVLFL